MKSDSKAQEREETCGNLNQPRPQPCGMWSHAQLNQRPSYRVLCWHYIPHFEASWFLIHKKFCQFSTDKSLSWLWRPRWKFQWIFNMTPLYTLLPEFIENFLSCSQTEWHAHMQTLPKTLPKLQSLWHRHGKRELFSVHRHYRRRSFARGELAELSLRSKVSLILLWNESLHHLKVIFDRTKLY